VTVRHIPPVVAADERAQIRWILDECKTIAVVGLSSSPYKDSYIVAHHLHRQGYDLLPINPKADTILGRPVFPSLSALPTADAVRAQLVLIFRPSDEVPQIVDAALAHLPNLKAIWMQKGIVNEPAVARARETGLVVVSDRCIRTQHLFTKFGRET
jgi:uncharacterized protein